MRRSARRHIRISGVGSKAVGYLSFSDKSYIPVGLFAGKVPDDAQG